MTIDKQPASFDERSNLMSFNNYPLPYTKPLGTEEVQRRLDGAPWLNKIIARWSAGDEDPYANYFQTIVVLAVTAGAINSTDPDDIFVALECFAWDFSMPLIVSALLLLEKSGWRDRLLPVLIEDAKNGTNVDSLDVEVTEFITSKLPRAVNVLDLMAVLGSTL
jgi:hypothetical protein